MRCACLVFFALLCACGEGRVVVKNESYEPRIAIEGILFPDRPVERIYLTRNFRLDAHLRTLDITLRNADARLIDEQTGAEYRLSFHDGVRFAERYYEYRGGDLQIEHGGRYALEVRATIEGRDLFARAVTQVPERGFRIASLNHERLPYRPPGEDGEPLTFHLQLERSPGTTVYLATFRALDASPESFVYDNPFSKQEPEEVAEDLEEFAFGWDWIQNAPGTAGLSPFELFWFYFWFYGRYEVVVLAVDANYARFLQTFNDVQEADGNFHEPRFSIEGDGIGVFGSALVDTVRLEVLRP